MDGVPCTIYQKEDSRTKPLIYFFHGFTGNKDANIMGRGEVLAELGFCVVAIDAYLHGKRMGVIERERSNIDKYQDIIEIVIHTAKDAMRLFHKYFKFMPNIQSDAYYAYGVSMGSLTAFYLSTIDDVLKAMVGLVCTPSFVDYYRDKAVLYGFNQGFFYEKKLDWYNPIDPMNQLEKLKHKRIFMGIGIKDDVVNPKYAIKLHELLPETILKSYDTGHISTKEMLEDSYNFLKQEVFHD
jgi:uncharacterized protein